MPTLAGSALVNGRIREVIEDEAADEETEKETRSSKSVQ
jgi:hypothetical protein